MLEKTNIGDAIIATFGEYRFFGKNFYKTRKISVDSLYLLHFCCTSIAIIILNEDTQQDRVGNYEDLLDAERALQVVKLIKRIPVPVDSDSEDEMTAARTAYNGLTNSQKGIVGNYQTLVNAEIALPVAKLIEAIPVTPLNGESKDEMTAARTAYDALLSDAQKDSVGNYDHLVDVEKAYAVYELIEAIPTPITMENKEEIENAKDEYGKLTEKQKGLVSNYGKLSEVLIDYVEKLIEAIGTVEDTEESKGKIDEARDAFDDLTPEQKAQVGESDKLPAAETRYETLHENNLAASQVIALINTIGEVEYTPESKAKIDAAKEAYENLTPEQKNIVDGYLTEHEVDSVVVSETIYIELGDQQKAQNVKNIIANIGEVKYPDSKEPIEKARTAYDQLTNGQKELVDNYSVLTAAEEHYKALEAKAGKLPGGAIAGIVVGCFTFAVAVVLIVIFLLRKKESEKK